MKNEALFRDKPVWEAIISLVIPSVLTILIMVIYNLADMFFIGMLGDDRQVAAVAVVTPVFSIANALATMIGAGGCAAIAHVIGEQKKDTAAKMFSVCIYASLAFGAIFGSILLLEKDPILFFLGTTSELTGFAESYMSVLAAGAPFMLFSIAMASAIRAEGIIIPGMLANIAGTVVNLALDPLFILVFGMGIQGAAIATVLGNVTACTILVRAMKQHSSLVHFAPQNALEGLRYLPHILATGLPNGVSAILSGLASAFSNQLLRQYGAGAIAAMAAAGRAVLVITMIQMGICIGVSPLLAYNCGAGNRKRLKETLVRTAGLAFGFGLLSAGLCLLGGEKIIALFLKDAANLALGSRMMVWLIIVSPLLGFYYLSSNFIQASGSPFQATVISVLRQGLLLIPALYILNQLFGLTGIAAAHAVADLLSVIIAVTLMLRRYRELPFTKE